MLDLIGYSTVPEDVDVAQSRLDRLLEYTLSVPWWAVWGFALLSTVVLIWVSWPRRSPEAAGPVQSSDPTHQYVSRFAGKAQAQPEPITSDIRNAIDYQDKYIDGLIMTANVWIRKHFDIPEPYIEFNIHLSNGSVFDLAYEGVQGRLFYRDEPLRDLPEITSHSELIQHNRQGKYTIRQFISSELRDLMLSHSGQLQELNPSQNFGIKFS